jgi:excisionase family DNA binding protein
VSKDFLTLREAAERLGLSYERTWALARSGALPCVRRGARWTVPLRAWERWIEKQAEEALAGVRQPDRPQQQRMRASART